MGICGKASWLRRGGVAAVLAVAAGTGVVAASPAAPAGPADAPARASMALKPVPEPARREAAAMASPIRHVVVLYMENHSFDNVLGFWCRRNPGRCPAGGMPARVTLSDGRRVVPSVDPDTVPVVSHSVASQLKAMNIEGGVPRMNGWQNIPSDNPAPDSSCDAASGYQCISGYEPGQIPNLARLATRFAVSDSTFSMGDSPSWGGHLYAVLGSLDGFLGNNPHAAPGVAPGPGWGCNSDKVAPWISPTGRQEQVPSCVPDYSLNPARYPYGGAFEATPVSWQPSILDRLDRAGLSWKLYDGGRQPATDGWAICPSLADCWYTSEQHHLSGIAQFRTNAADGTLPDFSVITPGNMDAKYSQHNGTSMAAGDNWIGGLVRAVGNGPDWSSTALFITWDDCGCFYDQAVPSRNPDGTWQGPRVPLIIVSPYARPGHTDNTHTTFAGILAYTEHTFGLAPLGANDARAYDFSGAFNYSQAPLKPVRMVTRPLPYSARHLHLNRAILDDPT
jgi:phospholipase C